MMTANDIFASALTLLGVDDVNALGYTSCNLHHRALSFVNRICGDLCDAPMAENLNDEITLSPEGSKAAPYGVAMLLALSEGDRDKNEVFCRIYNSFRAAAKGSITTVGDRLPRTEV